MTVRDIIQSLEHWAPAEYQEGYDNARLIVGDPNAKVEQVLCTLDCTEEVVREAIEKGCQLIVAHHPIVFGGLKSLTGKNYVERTVMMAIKNDVSIYAIHTNLDNVWTGVNRKIGEKLGLQDLKILSPKKEVLLKLFTFVPHASLESVRNALFAAGAGSIGDYDHCSFGQEGAGTYRGNEDTNPAIGTPGSDHTEPETKLEVVLPIHLQRQVVAALIQAHPYEEVAYDLIRLENMYPRLGSGMVGELTTETAMSSFMKDVSKSFKLKALRHTPILKQKIKKIAFCGGAGRFLLPDAIASGADVFITSDVKYHEFFDADGKIVIMDIGHFESEQFTPELIKEYLDEKFPTFAVLLSEAGTNPVHYYIA